MTQYIRNFMMMNTFYKLKCVTCQQIRDSIEISPSSSTWLIIQGAATISTDQEHYKMRNQGAFHCNSKQTYHIKPWHCVKIYHITYKSYALIDSFTTQYAINKVIIGDAKLLSLVEELYQQYEQFKLMKAQLTFQQLLFFLLNSVPSLSHSPMDKIATYITEHLYDSITTTQLSTMINCSPSHLYTLFSRHHQHSPKKLINNLREQELVYILNHTNYRTKAVAKYFNYCTEAECSRAIATLTSTKEFSTQEMSEKTIINENGFHYTNNQFARIIANESEYNKKMRKYMPITFLVSLLCLLAACSNTETKEQEKAITSETNVETRLFTDAVGREVEIPVEPKRIVTDQYTEALLVLGNKPVGANTVDTLDYLQDDIKGIEDIGSPINMEKIVDLKPDLIITYLEPGEENLTKMEKIAPTVVVPFLANSDIYQQLKNVAEVIDKQQAAEEWIAKLESKADVVKQEIATIIQPEETVTLMMTHGKEQPRIFGARNFGHLFYRLLDLKPIPFVEEQIEKDPNYTEYVYSDISLETLDDYAGDWIFILDFAAGKEADKEKTYNEMMSNPVWRHLEAVENNHVIVLSEYADRYMMYTPIAIEKSLDGIADVIKKQVSE